MKNLHILQQESIDEGSASGESTTEKHGERRLRMQGCQSAIPGIRRER